MRRPCVYAAQRGFCAGANFAGLLFFKMVVCGFFLVALAWFTLIIHF